MIRFDREIPDPLELVVKGHEDHLIGFACPQCGAAFLVHKRQDPKIYEARMKDERDHAAVHCIRDCICGKPIERSYILRCDECCRQMEADKERKAFEKAEKLTIEQYDGPVYWEGHRGDMGDGYFSDVDALLDYCEQEGVDIPEYAWSCTRNEMKLDAESIVEHATEEMFEDAYDHVPKKAIDSLQAYLDAWCTEVGLESWSDCQKSAVILREAEPAEKSGEHELAAS